MTKNGGKRAGRAWERGKDVTGLEDVLESLGGPKNELVQSEDGGDARERGSETCEEAERQKEGERERSSFLESEQGREMS